MAQEICAGSLEHSLLAYSKSWTQYYTVKVLYQGSASCAGIVAFPCCLLELFPLNEHKSGKLVHSITLLLL